MKYKMIAMDLDGTLTQHKSPLEPFNKAVLDELCAHYCCVIVGAGSCLRIYNQLGGYPIDSAGNYGMQQAVVSNGEYNLIKNITYTADKAFFDDAIFRLRRLLGYTSFMGESVEYHPSGAVTFPLLGTDAPLEQKLLFDPLGKRREAMYNTVATWFGDYNCFMGGTSSFDIVKKGFDKLTALKELAKQRGIALTEVLYLGDDFKRGGNDESVLLGGVDCVAVSDYTQLGNLLKHQGVII